MKLRVPYWAVEGFDIKLNGRSMAANYVPGSYFEIPRRRWTRRDSVEIIMPYVQRVEYGPDSVSLPGSDKPERLGVLMRGPLVMAAVGIKGWDEAVLRVGPDGQPDVSGLNLIPDFQADTSVTHYLRVLSD